MKIYDDKTVGKKFNLFVRRFCGGNGSPGELPEGSGMLEVYHMYIANTPPKSVSEPYPDPIGAIHAYCDYKIQTKICASAFFACICSIALAARYFQESNVFWTVTYGIISTFSAVVFSCCASLINENMKVVQRGKGAMKEFVELLQILGFRMSRHDEMGLITQYDRDKTFRLIAYGFLEQLACNWKSEQEIGRHPISGTWRCHFDEYTRLLIRMKLVKGNSAIDTFVRADGSFKTSNTVLPFT